MIAVIVPVLNRPHRAQPLADSFHAARSVDSRLAFVCSFGDDEQYAACVATGCLTWIVPWEPGPGDFARKVNAAFRWTDEPWIFQAADDVEFERGWDAEALRVGEQTGAGVVGTNDDANPLVKRGGHSTHSLIRRAYVDEYGASADGPGVVFHEGYGHQYVDNELCELARARGTWAFAASAVVRHRHPIFDRSVPRDDTYERGDSTRRQDARLFQRRRSTWKHVAHVPPFVLHSAHMQSEPATLVTSGL